MLPDDSDIERCTYVTTAPASAFRQSGPVVNRRIDPIPGDDFPVSWKLDNKRTTAEVVDVDGDVMTIAIRVDYFQLQLRIPAGDVEHQVERAAIEVRGDRIEHAFVVHPSVRSVAFSTAREILLMRLRDQR